MTLLFWSDIVALSIVTLVASALVLFILGANLRRPVNRYFALFNFAQVVSSCAASGMRLALWLKRGNPNFALELNALAFSLAGPFLLLFTVRHFDFERNKRQRTKVAAALGIAVIVVLAIPLFQHKVVHNPHLAPNGAAVTDVSAGGFLVALVPVVYMAWSLILSWKARRQPNSALIASSIACLLAGFILDALINLPLPILSVMMASSVSILGYTVISRQLFNPLRELTDELERKVVELRQSEEKFRAIYEGSNDAVMLLNERCFFDCNSRALEMFGIRSKQEFVSIHPADISPPFQPDGRDSAPATQERIQTAFRQGHNRFEWVHRRCSGEDFPAEVLLSAFDLDGETVLQATVRDISERKQVERERERLQQEVIKAQKQALQELSTPIIPLMERIIVMPLVGSIDSQRARDITRVLLAGIRDHRAKIVIMDITGVSIVDSGVVNHLNKTIQAARLKGAHAIVTGISDAVAESIVDLGIDWSNVDTLSNLQTGLVVALNSMGIQLTIA